MATKLTKPFSRESNKLVQRRPIIITIAPAGSSGDDLIGLRLKGTRTNYITTVSVLYQCAALWHANKEKAAKAAARKAGQPWKYAKAAFLRANEIPKAAKKERTEDK